MQRNVGVRGRIGERKELHNPNEEGLKLSGGEIESTSFECCNGKDS